MDKDLLERYLRIRQSVTGVHHSSDPELSNSSDSDDQDVLTRKRLKLDEELSKSDLSDDSSTGFHSSDAELSDYFEDVDNATGKMVSLKELSKWDLSDDHSSTGVHSSDAELSDPSEEEEEEELPTREKSKTDEELSNDSSTGVYTSEADSDLSDSFDDEDIASEKKSNMDKELSKWELSDEDSSTRVHNSDAELSDFPDDDDDDHEIASGKVEELFNAASSGVIDKIRELIQDGVDVDTWARYKGEDTTALQLASKSKHPECMRVLLESGGDIGMLDQNFTKSILFAAYKNDVFNLRKLAVAGFYKDIHKTFYKKLLAATKKGYDAVSRVFVSNKTLLKMRGATKIDELCFCILTGFPISCLDFLVKQGADVNGINQRGFTPLISAVLAGSMEWIETLVNRGADVNKQEQICSVKDVECSWLTKELKMVDKPYGYQFLDSDKKSPLIFAVWTGKLDIVKYFLRHKVEVEFLDSSFKSPLMHSIIFEQENIVDELLCHGADVNFYNSEKGLSPLHHAVRQDNEKIVTKLLNAGADVNALDKIGKTSFIDAVEGTQYEVMELLLKTGKVDINAEHDDDIPLLMAADYADAKLIRFLLKAGADVNVVSSGGEKAVEIAANQGNIKCLQILMKAVKNSSKSARSKKNELLHAAAQCKNTKMLEHCLKRCKNVDKLNSTNETALMCAVESGCTENVALLLSHGADINHKHQVFGTAISWALELESFDCFKLLLQAGADINSKCKYKPPLILAALKKDISYLKLIIEKDDKLIHNLYSGCTLLNYAIFLGKHDIVTYLLSCGADPNKTNKRGESPLMKAAEKGNLKDIELLVTHGANINYRNHSNMTATIRALRSEKIDCFKFLLQSGADVYNSESALVLACKKKDLTFLKILLERENPPINAFCLVLIETPLESAICSDNEKAVRLLLEKGAHVNEMSKGFTPIMCAVREGVLNIVEALLDYGACLDSLSRYGTTVLWEAFNNSKSFECLDWLLRKGLLMDSRGSLKPIHSHHGMKLEKGLDWKPQALILMFKYNVFPWKWLFLHDLNCNSEKLIDDMFAKISFAAVSAGNYLFPYDNMEGLMARDSLIQDAFLRDSFPTVQYLLANLFLTWEDYRALNRKRFKERMSERRFCGRKSFNTSSLLRNISSQPWRLETLCFITVSSSIAFSGKGKCMKRPEKVDALPIPEMFKSRLKFKGPVHKICPRYWSKVFSNRKNDLPNLSSQYCHQQKFLIKCQKSCNHCAGLAFIG